MKKKLSMLLAAVGIAVAGLSTVACPYGVLDEPKMPKSLLNK